MVWPNLGAAEDLFTALGNCGATLPASVLQPIIAGSFRADIRLKLSLTRAERIADDQTYRDLTPGLRGRVDRCARILGVEPVNLVSLAAQYGADLDALLDNLAAGFGQFFSPDFPETTFRSGLIPPAELKLALSNLTAALNEQSQKQTSEAFERLWDLVSDCERAAPRPGTIAGAAVFAT
jgi:hypothetical protein